MIEYISAFFTTLMWPLPHIFKAVTMNGENRMSNKATPMLDGPGIFSSFGAAWRNFMLAVFCIYGLYGGDDYPGFGAASVWSASWMWPIIMRNLVGTWLICGFWDWWLYFGPLKNKLFKFKIIQRYPSMNQLYHDALYTSISSVIAGIIEICLCHGWATGAIPVSRSLNDKPILHIILALTITQWRIPHFHLVHRAMHPWRFGYVPDFGRFLYRHVHSLHHKSSNITTFSGTNMHPVESILYYSAALLILPLGVHPSIVVAAIFDLAIGAWLGHDGFQYPGSGDVFHTLHHMHFDCNYGAQHIPLDYLLGTFAGCKEDVSAIWGKHPSGRAANETYVHADSPSDQVE